MFNDDYFDEDDYKEIEELLIQFAKIKNGEPHSPLMEDDFDYIIDYFEAHNDKENGLLACDIAITLYPYSVMLYLRKAEYLMFSKKYGQALIVLDEVEKIAPYVIDAVFMKSDILLDQDRHNEAILFLEKNISHFKAAEKVDLLLELTEIYDELEEFDMVYTTLKRILKYDPNNEDALMRVCFWAEVNNKHEDSIELHQEIIDNAPYNAMAWYNLGVAYQGIKLYEKAIDSYEYCLAIDEKFEYAYRNEGDAYMRLKKYDKAIEALEKNLEIAKPEDVILEAIGYCWEKQKNYTKARHWYRQASQLSPQDDEIFYKIGETYSKELQWEKAIKAYSVALHLNKDNVSYCLALGNCLMEINAPKEALVCFSNAVQLRPDKKSTWQALIKALYTTNNFDDALEQLNLAEDHCTIKSEFIYYRAAIYLAMGRTKDAVLYLHLALKENNKKVTALTFIDKETVRHPVFAEIISKYKKKK
jgi:tetratricopeptide (TPR) repeat protein